MQIGNASLGEVPYLISNDETFRQVGRRVIGHRHAPRQQSAIVAAMHLWCRDDRLCVQGESRRLGDPAASSAVIDSSTATRRGKSGSTKRAFTTPSRPARMSPGSARRSIKTIAVAHRGHTGHSALPWTVALRFDNATPLAGRPTPAHDEPKGFGSSAADQRPSLKTGRVRAEQDQSEESQ
jgi:hypothetical protein